LDIYSTTEPQQTFHQRIQFCLNLHNESVEALRFPQNIQSDKLKEATEILEQERLLAQSFIDEDMDEDMGDF
jgi:26S proteasome regulatory subunit N3